MFMITCGNVVPPRFWHNVAIAVAITTSITNGIKIEKLSATIGGTLSGILIVRLCLLHSLITSTARIAEIIATKRPSAPR